MYHALPEEYPYAFWISVESKEKLTSAYLDMAEVLGIPVDKQQVEKTIQEVRVRLAEQPCFYVFDNAPDHEILEAFFPLTHGHVLITSRNSAADAWEYATQRMPLTPFSTQEIMALAAKLECPLAPKDEATMSYLLEKISGYPPGPSAVFQPL